MKNKMEKGQSLILVTLLLFAFLAILALVLDGGFLYYLRRNAQNAADAGALAGADDLCRFKIPSQAEDVAEQFAYDNRVSTAVASATLMSPGGIVEVQTSIDYQTFFARLLNLTTVSPPAFAKAGCAPPEGIGVMPIAWSCKAPIGEPDPGEVCEIHKIEEDDLDCVWLEDPMYIIADSETIEVDTFCQDPTGEPPSAMDCDLDDDGVNDMTLLAGGDRSWLDLNAGGGGAAELIDWIEGDYDGFLVGPHYWVPAQTGVTASVYDAVFDNILNEDVVVPIFDTFCPDGPPTPLNGCIIHSIADGDKDDDTIVGNEPHDYFHIITLSYWRTTCIDSASHHGPCDAREALNILLLDNGWTMGDINSLQTMEGCFVKGAAQGIGGDPGQGIDTGLYTIFLME
jgi:hypothetical protein